jgi:mono/diheme cytochrome c family protein
MQPVTMPAATTQAMRASHVRWRIALCAAATTAALAAAACPDSASLDSVERGRRAYRSNCIACHGFDPALEGTLGPAVAESSRELLEARVLRGEYPEGYTPKRDTALMPPMPYLEEDIDALAAYLGQGER